jgi:uncharacterized protein
VSQTPTTIEPWLREILRCPQCKGELTDVHGGQEATVAQGADDAGEATGAEVTELQCPVCGLGYPIESGVPVLLVDLARRLG